MRGWIRGWIAPRTAKDQVENAMKQTSPKTCGRLFSRIGLFLGKTNPYGPRSWKRKKNTTCLPHYLSTCLLACLPGTEMYVLDMWAGKPDHSKPDPFIFGLIRRISDQSLQFPLGLVVPMPMMKKPAMQKKPAGCTDLVPYKKAHSEQDEHEEPEVEEGEEEEEEEEENEPDEEEAEEKEDKKQEPAPRLSKQALNDHTRFVQEACDKKLTQDQVEDAMRKTSPKTQMSLWKAFEADRVASGEQEQYVKAAAGPGN